jgi:hypothetical protein
MHPSHEMVKVLTPGRDAQALVELIHQPGLAATHRAPEVGAGDLRVALMQSLVTLLKGLHRLPLRVILDKALLFDGMSIGAEGGIEGHTGK